MSLCAERACIQKSRTYNHMLRILSPPSRDRCKRMRHYSRPSGTCLFVSELTLHQTITIIVLNNITHNPRAHAESPRVFVSFNPIKTKHNH
jgi:hypothetical protein